MPAKAKNEDTSTEAAVQAEVTAAEAQETTTTTVVGGMTDDDGWIIVDEGAPTMVTFEKIGETFVAVYKSKSIITAMQYNADKGELEEHQWTQHAFCAVEESGLIENGGQFHLGELLGINETAGMKRGMGNVPFGALVRLRYYKDVPTNKGNDMMSFQVGYKMYNKPLPPLYFAEKATDEAAQEPPF